MRGGAPVTDEPHLIPLTKIAELVSGKARQSYTIALYCTLNNSMCLNIGLNSQLADYYVWTTVGPTNSAFLTPGTCPY